MAHLKRFTITRQCLDGGDQVIRTESKGEDRAPKWSGGNDTDYTTDPPSRVDEGHLRGTQRVDALRTPSTTS